MEEEKKVTKQQSNKIVVIVIAIIVCALSFCCGYLFSKNVTSEKDDKKPVEEKEKGNKDKKDKEENDPDKKQEKELPKEETFDSNTESGKATIRGYVTTNQIPASEFGKGTVDSIFFNIVETNSNNFLSFIDGHKGNSYVGEKSFSIGCVKDNKLTYYNNSNETGMKEYVLDEETSKKILNSTKETPIMIEIERYLFTGGSGAPDCYSHISQIKVLD